MQDHLLIELCGDDHIVLDTDGTLPAEDVFGVATRPARVLDTDGTSPNLDVN